MIQLFDKSKRKIAGLIEYENLCIESILESGDKTLSFSYSTFSKFHDEIEEETYIRTKNDEYVVKAKSANSKDNKTVFTCKLNIEELEGSIFDRFESVEQNLINALNLSIVSTGWIINADNCTNKKKRTIRMTNCSSWTIIQKAKKLYDIEFKFDTLNKIIMLFDKIGEDKGAYFIDSLNLRALQVQGNSYGFYTRIIPTGKNGLTIASVNGGKIYLENKQYSDKTLTYYWKDERYVKPESLKEDALEKLNIMSKPFKSYIASTINLAEMNEKYKSILDYNLGDYVYLISKKNKIKDKHRIVKTKEYPQDHSKDTVELANKALDLTEDKLLVDEMSNTLDNVTIDNGTLNGSTIDSIQVKQIEDFKANVIQVTNLTAINARIDNLHAIKADIQDLNAVIARIGTLDATKANITELNAIHATIQELKVGKAEINDLNAAVAKVGILEGNVANINEIMAGNISSTHIQTGGITGSNLNMDTIFVKDSNIVNVNANKINTGEINTNKVKIKSEDGGIEIIGATQQFKDKNNKVRVQIGKDTKGDFNFIIRGEDGQSVLIDHTGIKKDAIADNLIVGNMIAADAVGEKQIDYSSFSEGFNKDTNANTLKATKVRLDNQAQTLEVAFNSLKNQSDSNKTKTESNTTQLNVQQGKINTLIQDTTIIKDGKTTKLKDDYNRTVATVDSIKNTISSHETLINQNTGKITGVESKTNTLERDLQSTTNKITNVEKNVDDLSIDNNNLIPNTDFSKDKTKYYKAWGSGTTIQYSEKPSINGQIVPSHILVVNKLNPTVAGGSVCIETPKIIGGIKANLEYTLSFKGMSRGNTGALDYLYIMSNEEGLGNYRIVNENNKLVINSFGNVEKVSSVTFKLNKTYKNASILIGKVKQALANENLYHGFGIWDIILTQGNKVIAWHSAAEDIRAEIDVTTSNVSEITQNLNSITQRVANTESTVKSNTSSINSINKNYSEISNKFAEIKVTTDNITNRVSSAEVKTNLLETNLDNLKLNTRNLLLNSNFANQNNFKFWDKTAGFELMLKATLESFNSDYFGNLLFTSSSIDGDNYASIFNYKAKSNTTYTLSFDYFGAGNFKYSENSSSAYIWLYKKDGSISNLKLDFNTYGDKVRRRYYKTFTTSNDLESLTVRIGYQTKGYAWMCFDGFKLVESDKRGDWTQAPEDMDQSIKDNIKLVTERINSVESSINQTTSSISQKVTENKTLINSVNGNVTNVVNRVNVVESKITTSAIINSVSSGINNNGLSINTVSTVLNASGLTINNGALRVKNRAGKTVLEGDTGGNLVIKEGAFKVLNPAGDAICAIEQDNFLKVYGLRVFGANNPIQFQGPGEKGIELKSENGPNTYIDFGFANQDFKNRIICYSDKNELILQGRGVEITPDTTFTNEAKLEIRANAGGYSYIDFSNNYSEDYSTRLISFNGDTRLHVFGGLVVDSGTKSAMQRTEHYGDRLMYAVEACQNYFEDIYTCSLENGVCTVEMDKIFLECVNCEDYAYYIILDELEECNGLFAPKALRTSTKFIVKEKNNGKSNAKFNVIVRARRKNFETERLEEMKRHEIDKKILQQ